MIYPQEKYRELKGWVPASDISGVDISKEYVRDCRNIDFNSTFVSNASAPIFIPNHLNPNILILSGWELLAKKYFNHSEQGDTYIYILYKYESLKHKLRYFVNNTEIFLENGLSLGEVDAKPSNISYNLVEDQLKINLNVKGEYDTDKYVYVNLTLQYFSSKSYDTYNRPTGWYLVPRWLGWTYIDGVTLGTPTTTVIEDFEDATFISGWSVVGTPLWARSNVNPISGSYSYLLEANGTDDVTEFMTSLHVTGINSLKTLSFDWNVRHLSEAVPAPTDFKTSIIVQVSRSVYTIDEGRVIYRNTIPLDGLMYSTITLDIDAIRKLIIFLDDAHTTIDESLSLTLYVVMDKDRKLRIDNFTLKSHIDCPLIVKNKDGQRGLVKKVSLDVYNRSTLIVNKSAIDWRVNTYEIYYKSPNDNIHYLLAEADVEKNPKKDEDKNNEDWVDWTVDATTVYKELKWKESVNTLNFNYGLGGSIYVYDKTDNIIGKIILREAFYRGRSYFVDGSNRLYFSHISGTALAQPDSFPFDKDARFGYYTTSSDASNRSLAVTSLEEIVIHTDKLSYIYTIEGTAGTPLRRIKALNGSMGILSTRSSIVDLSGTLEAKILMWEDRWAIYGYAGGREIPVSLIANTHKNYWKEVVGKEDAVAIYNKARNEYWLQLDDHILIYEIDTNIWKKYEFEFKIKDIVGIIGDYTYILGDNNKTYKLDPSNPVKLSAMIEFHDNSGFITNEKGYVTPSSEIQDKILQDMFIVWKDICGGSCEVQIIADDNIIDSPITLSTAYSRFPSTTPLSIIYGRIRFKIDIDAVTAKLEEFGFEFAVLPTVSPSASALSNVEGRGIGQEAGGELGVVF